MLTAFLLCVKALGFGLNDGYMTTPGGHTIHSNGGLFLVLQDGREIENISSWYFYKGHIICDANHFQEHYIIDETNRIVYHFSDKKNCLTALNQYQLIPKIWHRPFTDVIPFYTIFYLWCLFLAPVSILFGLCLIYLIYGAIRHEKLAFYKPRTLILILLATVAFIRYLLDVYPQSI